MTELQPYQLSTLDTGLPALNELLMGGIGLGTLTQIYGGKGSGKTLLSMQLAYRYIMQEHKSVLYWDTEIGFDKAVKRFWYLPFNKRFGVEPQLFQTRIETYALKGKHRIQEKEVKIALEAALSEIGIKCTDEQLNSATRAFLPEYKLVSPQEDMRKDSTGIFVLECGLLEEVLAVHGVKAEVLASEAGRVEVRVKPESIYRIESSPIGVFVRSYDIGLVIYDSVTAPIKERFIATQDFPGRAAAINLWMGRVEELCHKLQVTALVVNHESVGPLDHRKIPYATTTLGYRTKFILHIQSRSPDPKSPECCLNPELASEANRVVYAARHPRRPDHSACILLKLNENGFT
ncbi:AAA family ATPase [Candidatus Bathyarchaeota archaeon]|nr:AAA family ATPase [Candidatus Bathyarchaeota archaeon]